ncbi:MAG: hypothetical protein ACSHYB_18640 [Roseibacillus sp.]
MKRLALVLGVGCLAVSLVFVAGRSCTAGDAADSYRHSPSEAAARSNEDPLLSRLMDIDSETRSAMRNYNPTFTESSPDFRAEFHRKRDEIVNAFWENCGELYQEGFDALQANEDPKGQATFIPEFEKKYHKLLKLLKEALQVLHAELLAEWKKIT